MSVVWKEIGVLYFMLVLYFEIKIGSHNLSYVSLGVFQNPLYRGRMNVDVLITARKNNSLYFIVCNQGLVLFVFKVYPMREKRVKGGEKEVLELP